MKTAATAVIVGIALLVGSNAAVQAACNPPVRDVCFHKEGDWTTFDSVEMIVDFHVPSSKAGTTYKITWSGYQWFSDPSIPFLYGEYRWGKSQHDDIVSLSSGKNELSHWFVFDPDRNREDDPYIYDSYSLTIWGIQPTHTEPHQVGGFGMVSAGSSGGGCAGRFGVLFGFVALLLHD